MSDVRMQPLTVDMAPAFAGMTFPAYRHLLRMEPAPRHLDDTEQATVQPVAVAATLDAEAVGLALGEVPVNDPTRHPELLSLFVRSDCRGRGLGRQLLGAFEDHLRDTGHAVVDAVYMTGRPTTEVIEHLFAARGWGKPVTRTITVRFTPEEAARTPWFQRVRLSPDEFEIFPWTDLTPDERDRARTSHDTTAWIAKGLEFWKHDYYGFDPISSLGLRYRGDLVGWVINHRISADCVRFTCSYMRQDLSRRGRILPLYTESITRINQAGIKECSLVTPLEYAEMAEFLRRRCASAVHFFAETRASAKLLRDLGRS